MLWTAVVNIIAEYYSMLGVDSSASDEEVKSAFRKALKQNHPDSNHGHSAAEKTRQIIDAYQNILRLRSSKEHVARSSDDKECANSDWKDFCKSYTKSRKFVSVAEMQEAYRRYWLRSGLHEQNGLIFNRDGVLVKVTGRYSQTYWPNEYFDMTEFDAVYCRALMSCTWISQAVTRDGILPVKFYKNMPFILLRDEGSSYRGDDRKYLVQKMAFEYLDGVYVSRWFHADIFKDRISMVYDDLQQQELFYGINSSSWKKKICDRLVAMPVLPPNGQIRKMLQAKGDDKSYRDIMSYVDYHRCDLLDMDKDFDDAMDRFMKSPVYGGNRYRERGMDDKYMMRRSDETYAPFESLIKSRCKGA